jgi:hypothetical protein
MLAFDIKSRPGVSMKILFCLTQCQLSPMSALCQLYVSPI